MGSVTRNVDRKFPLPLVFFDWVSTAFPEGEEASQRAVFWRVVRGLRVCGVVRFPFPSDIRYVFERLREVHQRRPKEEVSEDAEKAVDRLTAEDFKPESYGEFFMRWAMKLGPYEICAYLADGDPVRALEIYRTVDRDDVLDTFEVKTNHEMERIRYTWEAAMFGFGGSYGKAKGGGSKSTSDEDGTVHDMTTPEGAAAAMSALRARGL